jgi:hypothetical protein
MIEAQTGPPENVDPGPRWWHSEAGVQKKTHQQWPTSKSQLKDSGSKANNQQATVRRTRLTLKRNLVTMEVAR